MKRKYGALYAARVGDESKIFTSWSECQKFTHGRHAKFKKFTSEKEAKAWLEDVEEPTVSKNALHVYTDGSLVFHEGENRMGIGACYKHNDEIYEFSSKLTEEEIKIISSTSRLKDLTLSSSLAELCAIGFALRNKFPDSYDEIVINVDNDCAPGWITGNFKINQPFIVPLVESIRELMRSHKKVTLVHVKGHSNDIMNSIADRLAGHGSRGTYKDSLEFKII